MLPAITNQKNTRLLAAFGAGVVCALILPKAFFCFVGASLLLAIGFHLSQNPHNRSADMKIVLMRSPGFLAPLLRRIFHVPRRK